MHSRSTRLAGRRIAYRKFAPRRRVLDPGQGRLRHQITTRLGQTPTGQLERGVEAQNVEVVAILIAAAMANRRASIMSA